MELNRELLKSVLDNLGYEFEFDSTTPGVSVGKSIIDWDSIAALDPICNDFITTTIIKTSMLTNLTFTKIKPKVNETFEKTEYKNVGYQGDTSISLTGRLVA
ncbi:TPA: hypothetical protein I0F45_RS01980 [Enterococcus faecalis]|uniref:hypothetical protein n=1 Tax=Enterococcus faecalis TaxID=1351 RepID=UPI0011425809|nr:hypothetical protein [Enterococcus faecalis]NST45451.1 hypothetical protein [Enterococcus faecalis]NSV46363.1 hypothetical protein [Enterococcus faecalis]TQA43077.1 hypothetical protein FKY76_11190 [Enterococcus faecalis]HBI1673109.1 hypothetical protein [Enterococcus faecalis]HBI1681240.1 hypothetical protein [Enterococcus faecalis]